MSDTKDTKDTKDVKETGGTRKRCSYIKLATANYNEISESDFSYCIYCYGLTKKLEESKIQIHDMDWIPDKTGSTALCKKCSVDAIIPGNHFKDKDGKVVEDEMIIEQLTKWYDEGFVLHYVINFDKIKNRLNKDDFRGDDWCYYHNTIIYDGIHWDESIIDKEEEPKWKYSPYNRNVTIINLHLKEPKWKYSPLKCIDEGINDHMTQLLFIIKEHFTDKNVGFTGWKSFTEESLKTIIKHNILPYYDWDNCEEFIKMFPAKIIQFLKCYCDTV